MQSLRLLRAALGAAVFFTFFIAPLASPAQVVVGVGVAFAPPAIPVYTQPACPNQNYIWEPGYWAWGPGGYYWVPGTWVVAPEVGYLWTPGYWGWNNNAYYWHRGYWGRNVGFYGGINYGFGYYGSGYVGGRWDGNVFRYNTAVTNINRVVIHNTYVDRTVVARNNSNRKSYNGGNGGIRARATTGELTAARNQRPPTAEQQTHEQTASQDRNHLATVNHGHPATTAIQHPYSATNRPAHFTPVTSADRQAAQSHVVAPRQAAPSRGQKPPL
jgi:hypothetical protein